MFDRLVSPSAPTSDSPSRRASRWVALDRLRALAVVAMIQGHVFSALLRPDALAPGTMRWHERLHGLTAPAFMFGAGLALGSATYGSYGRYRELAAPLARRLRWYVLLFVLGYVVQAPGCSLWSAVHAQGDQLVSATRVGALQLVAFALCASQLMIVIVPRPGMHVVLNFVLGAIAIVAATPAVSAFVAPAEASFWSAFLEDRGGAHFQPLPWAGFVWLGVSAVGALRRWPAQRLRGPLLLLSGAACASVAYMQFHLAAETPEPGWLWRTSPSYFLFRLGCVVLLLGALQMLPERADAGSRGWSALFARHSLVAYVVHLWLLHGTRLTPNIADRWRGALNIEEALLATAALFAITLAAVYAWVRVRAAFRGAADHERDPSELKLKCLAP